MPKVDAPYTNHQHAVKILCDADFRAKHNVQDLLDLLEVTMPTVEDAFVWAQMRTSS